MELHYGDAETLNLTLYGLSNHNSLHLHPPEEEDKEEDLREKGGDDDADDDGQMTAFYCCLPALPTSESVIQSHCLLWYTNLTELPMKSTEKGWCEDKNAESLIPWAASQSLL